MVWLMALVIVFFIALYVLYYLNVYVYVRYQRGSNDDNVFIRIYVLHGLFSYTLRVPVMEVDWQSELVWFQSEIKDTKAGRQETRTVFERHIIKKIVDLILYQPRRFQRIVHRFRVSVEQYRRFIHRLHAKVYCQELHCKVQFGAEDSAVTGFIIGSMWMMKGILIAVLRNHLHFLTCPVIHIVPVFGKTALVVDLECILRIRLGNVINALTVFRNVDTKGGTSGG